VAPGDDDVGLTDLTGVDVNYPPIADRDISLRRAGRNMAQGKYLGR
jgi:hypothetical protein